MKLSSLALVVLVSILCETIAFQASHRCSTKVRPTTHLNMQGMERGFWGSVVGSVVGLAFAGQVATAAIPDNAVGIQVVPTIITSAVDTLDFSLPSYDDSVRSTTAVPKKDAPTFNPFGDFQPDFVKPDTSSADEEKAAARAAADAKKAEERAAAEAKRAEERAARDEERAARDAKRLEERQAAEERKSATTSAPSEVSVPDLPEFKVPEFKAPDITLPEFKAPDMPKFSMPNVEMPKVSFDMPKIDTPKLDLPKVDFPSVSLPSFGGFGESKSDSSPKEYAAQEVRDEAARQARKVYLEADASAKEVEAQARAARDAAKEQLKVAKEAKDLACETRPGGKLICLRNPFSAGF